MDLNKLKGMVPDSVINALPVIQSKFGINTPLRLAHFLAQTSLESGQFKTVNESLNYKTSALTAKFASRITAEQAGKFGRDDATGQKANQEAIGNIIYGGAWGKKNLGNTEEGDGFKFRGRGFIQLTGRSNYAAFSKFIGEDCVANPDLVASKFPLESAVFFFNNRKIWATCDKGPTDEVVASVTKLVNGADSDLKKRQDNFRQFFAVLNAQ